MSEDQTISGYAMLAAAPTVTRTPAWIDIKERRPDSGDVCFITDGRDVALADYIQNSSLPKGYWSVCGCGGHEAELDFSPTHWQSAKAPKLASPVPDIRKKMIPFPRFHMKDNGEPFEDKSGEWIDAEDALAELDALKADIARHIQIAADLAEEVRITDAILDERNRVLRAIPGCDAHGEQCVPSALEWIEKAKDSASALASIEARTIERCLAVAESAKKNIAQNYQLHIDSETCPMGNMDWAELEGAVRVCDKLRALLPSPAAEQNSRSQLRRIAAQKGEPTPRFEAAQETGQSPSQVIVHNFSVRSAHQEVLLELEGKTQAVASTTLTPEESAALPPERQERGGEKQQGFCILNKDGEIRWGECCVSSERDELQGELQFLQDEIPDGGWHIAPFYAAPLPPEKEGGDK